MQLPQLHRIYLEDYLQQTNLNLTHALIALIACEPSEAIVRAQALAQQHTEPDDPVLNFIETVLVYKLPHLSRKEIRTMLGLDTQLKQTRFYQEIAEEERQEGWQQGKIEGKAALLQQLLTKRFGPLSKQTQLRLTSASLEQLELWADRILDAPTLSSVLDEH